MERAQNRRPFNHEYRDFAEAAKKAGFDKAERKAAVHDPTTLLEGAERSTRIVLTPQMLYAFFNTLQPSRNQLISQSNLLELGRFLYNYRDKDKRQSQEDIPEKERQLLNLYCHLIEDAFYEGRLIDLDDKDAALLTFTVNSVAKIFDNPRHRRSLEGFDLEKARRFLSNVDAFEGRQLVPHIAPHIWKSIPEQGFEELQTQIDTELTRIRALPQPPQVTGGYFSGIANELNEAVKLLVEDPTVPAEYKSGLRSLTEHFVSNVHQIKEKYVGRIDSLRLSARLHDSEGAVYDFDTFAPNTTYADIVIAHAKSTTGKKRRQKVNMFERNPLVPPAYRESSSESRILNRLRKMFRRPTRELIQRSPEVTAAAEVVRRFVQEPIGKIYADYLMEHHRLLELVRKRNQLRAQDRPFRYSLNIVSERIARKNAVLYLVKDSLIANDKLRKSQNPDRVIDDEMTYARKEDTTYDFLAENRGRKEGSYSAVHYDPSLMPFAIWAVKYLRAKQGE